MRRPMKLLSSWILVLLAGSWTLGARADWSSNTFIEGVSDYSYVVGNHSQDIAGHVSATDFYNGLPSILPVANRSLWTDSDVWDTDTIDTDRSSTLTQISSNIGQDKYYFDGPGNAVSFIHAHGLCPYSPGPCPPLDSQCVCNWTSQCQSGQQCQVAPNGVGVCHMRNDAAIATSSPGDSNGHRSWYGSGNRQQIALGEDVAPKNWGGVGQIGGTNAAFIVSSCGAQPNYFWNNQRPMFVGLHLLASNLVVVGDTSGGYQWGGIIAAIASANINAPVSQAWFDSMSQITVGGAVCPGNGGWNGYSGCGANLVVSWSHNSADAQYHVTTESWSGVRNNAYDPMANNYGYGLLRCNYDCNKYPMTR